MRKIKFEEVRNEHLPKLLDIYNYYVVNSTATFHTHLLSIKEMKELVMFDSERYRTFVIIVGDEVCGYVILTVHSKREAYRQTADVTVYLKHDYTGRGIGSSAIKYIEDFARLKGFHVLIAGICGENSNSIALFESNGYDKCAHYKEVGFKFGRLLDVVYYQKIIS